MKITLVTAFVVFVSVFLSTGLYAKSTEEYREQADGFYQDQEFRKAHKIYYKLAKTGDHYSQDQLAHMYAEGEGKSTDIVEAYAWSVLAAQSGDEEMVQNSEQLFSQLEDKGEAEKRAEELKRKYSDEVLAEKERIRAQRSARKRAGNCTGSRITC